MAEKEVALLLTLNSSKAIKTVGELKKGIADTRKELEKTEIGTKKFDELSEAIKQAEGRITELNAKSTFLRDMPGPIGAVAKGFHGMKTAVLQGAKAFFTLSGAVAATGIGLLLIAFGSLQAYFSRTEEGAQKLRVIMAFFGAAVDKIADVFVKLGENMVNAFENPQKSLNDFVKGVRETAITAFEYLGDVAGSVGKILKGVVTFDFNDVSEGVAELSLKFDGVKNSINGALKSMSDFANEVTATAMEGAGLENALNKVLMKERELRVERAEANKTLSEQRNLAKDLSLSLEERIAALTMANELEQSLLVKELENESERLRIMEAKAALAKSDEDTLNAIADQQVRVANIEEQSLNKRRELLEQLTSLRNMAAAEDKAKTDAKEAEDKERFEREAELRRQLRDSEIALIQEDRDRELEAIAENFQRKMDLITEEGEIESALRQSLLDEMLFSEQQIRDKYAKLEADKKKQADEKTLAAEKALASAKISAAQSVSNVLGAISSVIQGESEAAVAARKVLAIAQIAIDTATAISGAISTASKATNVYEMIAGIAAGVAAVVSAIGQATTIINGVSVGGGSAPTPSVSVPNAPSVNPVTTNTTELGNTQQANLAPIQAYVVETELTGTQNNVSQIESQATFGGG